MRITSNLLFATLAITTLSSSFRSEHLYAQDKDRLAKKAKLESIYLSMHTEKWRFLGSYYIAIKRGNCDSTKIIIKNDPNKAKDATLFLILTSEMLRDIGIGGGTFPFTGGEDGENLTPEYSEQLAQHIFEDYIEVIGADYELQKLVENHVAQEKKWTKQPVNYGVDYGWLFSMTATIW